MVDLILKTGLANEYIVALATLLRLKTKVRGGGSATRVAVELFEFSYTDMPVIVEGCKDNTVGFIL